MSKVIFTLCAILYISLPLQSQISGSAKLGLSGYQGDLHCRTDEGIGMFDALGFSAGLGIRVPFSNTIGLRAEATYFDLSGDETQFDNAGHAARGWGFDNKFIEVAALLDWEILGNRRFTEVGTFKRTLTPVIFGGVGLGFNSPDVDFRNSSNTNISTDQDEGDKLKIAVPVGVGLKYYLTERFALGLEAGIRLPLSDYYDGVSEAANPEDNDSYGFGGVKAYFALGKKPDADGDGIVDKKDLCPTVPGLKAFDGCPDTDSDGIADKDDSCPQVAGLATLKGCPDADADGIADKDDTCPNVAGLADLKGCPDTDGDGIADQNDNCPEVAGGATTIGCPDTDKDGIIDKDDKCPDVAGIASKAGCPFVDGDSDGVEDDLDDCPDVAGSTATKGCPDSDGDGVADKDDKCPSTAGTTESGCPKVVAPVVDIASVRRGLGAASRNIRFGTSKSGIGSPQDKYLDEVASILNANPTQKIRIHGYTDNVGRKSMNQKLSEDRAKMAYNYLVNKGISPDRMTYHGYGESNPVASNANAAGRKLNRRVEIVLADEFGVKGGGTVIGVSPSAYDCGCAGTTNPIFQIPLGAKVRSLTKLGTNPEFGNSQTLDASGFYEKLRNAYTTNSKDKKFLDDIFIAMGYSGFGDASAAIFSEVVVPNGTVGNMGYSKNHKTLFSTLEAKSEKDQQAFRVSAANGCDIHFMKTCGNHFYFCPN